MWDQDTPGFLVHCVFFMFSLTPISKCPCFLLNRDLVYSVKVYSLSLLINSIYSVVVTHCPDGSWFSTWSWFLWYLLHFRRTSHETASLLPVSNIKWRPDSQYAF